VPGYTFRVFVTSCSDPPEGIWRDYNRRADMENQRPSGNVASPKKPNCGLAAPARAPALGCPAVWRARRGGRLTG
jgi:hypothetical protein